MSEAAANTLVLTAQQVAALREHLLRDDDYERVAVVTCRPSTVSDGTGVRLLGTDLYPVPDDDLVTQGRTACRPALSVEQKVMAACRRRNMHPLVVHSHPFERCPTFSDCDADLMNGYRQWLTGLYPDLYVAFAVFGTHGIATAVSAPDGDGFDDLPVTVVGAGTLDPPLTTPTVGDATSQASVDRERYDRSIRALTATGQQQLADTHIALVGAGGLGSLMAEMLARYGVHTLTVVDPDTVARSNLPRLFGCHEAHIGQPKVTAVAEHVRHVNPAVDVTARCARAEAVPDRLKRVDLIVAGVDHITTRLWLNQFTVRHLIPYVDAGVIVTTDDASATVDDPSQQITGMEGYLQLVAPGATACFDCLDRGDPEAARLERLSAADRDEERARGYIDDSDLAPEPAVVPLNGIVAAKTVQLIAKHVTGYADPAAFLRVETVANDLTELHTRPSANCPTCGRNGILGRGDPSPRRLRGHAPSRHRNGPEDSPQARDLARDDPKLPHA